MSNSSQQQSSAAREAPPPAPKRGLGAILRRLRTAGVIDGVWTAAASAGSKVQTLVTLSIAGRISDIEGLGLLVLATSLAVLTSSVADLGLTSQAVRAYASGGVPERRTVLGALSTRLWVCLPISVGAAIVVALVRDDITQPVLWVTMITGYALCYLSAIVVTQMAYGMGRFKGGAALNGVIRAGTIPVLIAVSLTGVNPLALIGVLAAGELLIAILQYRKAPRLNPRPSGAPVGLRLRDTWRFGVGPIVNTIVNRSDTVIISGVASPRALGVYAVASQVENALTTTALVPAGAAVAYSARAKDHADAVMQRRTVALVVALAYVAMALPFFIFVEPLTRIVFGVTIDELVPVRILIVAGIFSCLGGVAMQLLTGQGKQNTVAMIWLVTAVVAVAGMAAGAYFFGALGAALGAAARDVLFFVLAWASVFSRRSRRAEEIP